MAASVQRAPASPAPAPSARRPRPVAPSPASLPLYLSNAAPALRLGAGQPLSERVRQRLDSSLGFDFSSVRVYKGAAANKAADAMDARAYTIGTSIVLGTGQSADDLNLMGHEAAHVIHQSGAPAVHKFSPASGDPLETEAAVAGQAVAQGAPARVEGRASPGVQRDAFDWAESAIWNLLDKYSPDLVPILRKGPEGALDYLKAKVSSALQAIFDFFMAPLRAVGGVGSALSKQFAPLVEWIKDAAAKIAKNDCSPLREAADKIEAVITAIITPIVEKIQKICGKIGDFFKSVWDKIGAPIWNWIKEYAGEKWDQIQQLATWIWDKTEPVRKVLNRAWVWIKNKLGIGEGPEGHNGLLQWVQRKVESVWDWISAKIEPYKKQLLTAAAVVGGILVLISPAGPIIVLGGIVIAVVQGVRWIKANWGKGNLVVQARAYLEKTLIPSLLGGIKRMTDSITRVAYSINGKLGDLSASMGRMVGAVAESILRFAVAAAQWIADEVIALTQWGTEKLQALADWIGHALSRLAAFLKPVLDFLGKVASLLLDIWGLPLLLAGKLWNLIPRCIRDPFVDWIVPLILKQIDIFKELVKDNEAWQKTKADVMNLIHLVFVNKDLKGAIKAAFNLILRVFNVPMQLLITVMQKAAVAWDVVTAAPIRFIKNCVRTVGRGLKLYYDHLKENLLNGLDAWLFGELAEKGVSKPKSWTDPWDLMQFALDVMGISMSHIFDLMEKKFDPATVQKLRAWYGRLSRAWDWIMEMRGKKPAEVSAEIINVAKGFGKSILESLVVWIVTCVGAELGKIAAAAAASAGLSEVLDAIRRIYRATKTAVKWLSKILDMVNRALDAIVNIAAGVLEPAAMILEKALKSATPVVIAFLADQVGLGDVGQEIRDIIDKLRAKVDEAILTILDKLKGFFAALAAGAKDIVAKLREWWKKTKIFSAGGETHKLFFQGDEDSAQLTVQSKQRPLEKFLEEAKANNRDQATLDRIAEQYKRLLAARSELRKLKRAQAPEAQQQPHLDIIDAAFDAIGADLATLFQSDGAGTDATPIPIDWPKPTWNKYPMLRLYWVDAAAGSHWKLTAKKDPSLLLVQEYFPTGNHQLKDASRGNPPADLEKLGIREPYRIEKDKKVGRLSDQSTPGGSELNDLLDRYGWSASDEKMDGDHVEEIQFGGRDELANLWPLDASINRGAGSRLSRAPVHLSDKEILTIDLLKRVKLSDEDTNKKKFTFEIKSVLPA